MPILSSVLECMGYSYLVSQDQPRGHPPVDPSTLGGISPYITRLPQVLLQCNFQSVPDFTERVDLVMMHANYAVSVAFDSETPILCNNL